MGFGYNFDYKRGWGDKAGRRYLCYIPGFKKICSWILSGLPVLPYSPILHFVTTFSTSTVITSIVYFFYILQPSLYLYTFTTAECKGNGVERNKGVLFFLNSTPSHLFKDSSFFFSLVNHSCESANTISA